MSDLDFDAYLAEARAEVERLRQAAALERARIVAWMRADADKLQTAGSVSAVTRTRHIANQIESGAHLEADDE